jgi:hypothetical protein
MGHGEPRGSELEAVWQRAVACAHAYDDAGPVEPMLEAGALGVVLEATGALARVPERERRLVRDATRRALLRARPSVSASMEHADAARADAGATGPDADASRAHADASRAHHAIHATHATHAESGARTSEDDDDDADALRIAAELAREGVRALAGQPPPVRSSETSAWHPAASALVAMTRGAPDGLAAASIALHVGRCAACLAALQIGSTESEMSVPLRAAAASAPSMLPPQGGRVVATRTEPAAEAVIFDDALGVLVAIYASESLPVRYVASGLTTQDMRPGYWAGRCAPGATQLDGTLHVGDRVVAWTITLTE